ncbi:MAG: hypothetical protein KDA21_11125 [Phycisphaerales bacterium]|nr:hypothetical protein [Phycisphaerales bacterium]
MLRRITTIVIITLTIVLGAAVCLVVWMLTLTPGPLADFSAAYAEVRAETRPSPDTPDAWNDLVACLIDLRTAIALAAGADPDALPDFARLYTNDRTSPEDDALFGAICAIAETPRFDAIYELNSDATSEEAARTRATLAQLDTETFRAHLDALGRARWFQPRCAPGPGRDATRHDITDIMVLSRCLIARFTLAWQRDDQADVRRCADALTALSLALRRQPFQMEYRIGLAIQNFLVTAIVKRIGDGRPGPLADALIDDLVRLEQAPHWTRSLRGERLGFDVAIDLVYTGHPGGNGRFLPGHAVMTWEFEETEDLPLISRINNLRGGLAPDRIEMQTLVDGYWDEVLALDAPDAAAITAIGNRYVTRLNTLAPDQAILQGPFDITLDEFFVNSIVDTLERESKQIDETRRAVIVALLIERQHDLSGTWPASLAGIDDPRMPAHEALIYRRLEATAPDSAPYVLYSKGDNQRDDGGDPALDRVVIGPRPAVSR